MTQKQWDEHVAKGGLPDWTRFWAPVFWGRKLAVALEWKNSPEDRMDLRHGLVFRTKAQAVACAKRMLAAAKDGNHADHR